MIIQKTIPFPLVFILSLAIPSFAETESLCRTPIPKFSGYLFDIGSGANPEDARNIAIYNLTQFLGARITMSGKTESSNRAIETDATLETNWDSKLPGIETIESCQIGQEWNYVVGIKKSTIRKMIVGRQESRIKMLKLVTINSQAARIDPAILVEAEEEDRSLWVLTGGAPALFPNIPLELLAHSTTSGQLVSDTIAIQEDDELGKKTIFALRQHIGSLGRGFTSQAAMTWTCRIDSGMKTSIYTRFDAVCKVKQLGRELATHSFSGFAPNEEVLTSAVNGITESIERNAANTLLVP